MADSRVTDLPLLADASGSVLYAVKGGVDYQVTAATLQGSIQPQAANLVYAGPPQAPGGFPTFRPLVQADIPNLSSLYLSSTGGNLSGATINTSTFTGGNISGTTAVFDDNKFTVRDQTDTTKQFQFEANAISAGATRTYTMPNATTTLVGTDVQQTLSNKTMYTVPSISATAGLRVPHGVPPTAPVNGDVWTTNAGMYVQVNNATIGPLAAAASSTVTTFNGRQGAVQLLSTDIVNALGYTPFSKFGDSATGTIISGTSSGELRIGSQDSGNSSVSYRFDGTMASVVGGSPGTYNTIWNSGNFNPANPVPGSGTIQLGSTSGSYAMLDFAGRLGLNGGAMRNIITSAGGTIDAGTLLVTAGAANPNNLNTWAYNASGSYGGGYKMVDGSTQGGIYMSGGKLCVGVTGNTTITLEQFTFDSASNFVAKGNVTGSSDARLKTNIRKIENALDMVDNMRGVYYDRIDMDAKGVGVIAQEMEKVLPEVVVDGEFKSVAYGNISAVLIEAIKELRAEVQDIKSLLGV